MENIVINSRFRGRLREIATRGSRLLAAGLSMLAASCSQLRTTPIPLHTRTWPVRADRRAQTLVVLLPGRGDRPGDFERHGFISILQKAGINADVTTVDAHLGYYYKRTVIERLQADVLAPARARGYRRIVVAGISLGGLGTLLTARDQSASVDALILLSPYVGDDGRLFREIAAAGGPAAWAAQSAGVKGKVDREIWSFLGERAATLPPTWLLFGADDRLGTGQRLLASLLPPTRVTVIPGGHDWRTWEKLWNRVCTSSDAFAEEKRAAF